MNAPEAELERLEVFFGDANPAEARIYARLPRHEDIADCRLTGEVVGPRSSVARTLPAKIPFTLQPEAASTGDRWLLAEAVVPDPCFWTPASPNLYDVRVELQRGSQTVAEVSRTLGIRRLARRRRRLVFDGDTWALRAMCSERLPPDTPLAEWHAAATAMVVADPDERLCEAASQIGVLLIAKVTAAADSLPCTVKRLSRSAAVGMVVINEDLDDDVVVNARRRARNVLFAWKTASLSFPEPPAWADAVVCPVDDVQKLSSWAAECSLPVIACRPAGQQDTVSAARAACDRLQRDLAGRGDWAGYLV